MNSNTEDTYVKVNKGKAHLSKGNHVLYLQTNYAENIMESALSTHFANVRLMPQKKTHKSRLFKRYKNKHDDGDDEEDKNDWDEDEEEEEDDDDEDDRYSQEK